MSILTENICFTQMYVFFIDCLEMSIFFWPNSSDISEDWTVVKRLYSYNKQYDRAEFFLSFQTINSGCYSCSNSDIDIVEIQWCVSTNKRRFWVWYIYGKSIQQYMLDQKRHLRLKKSSKNRCPRLQKSNKKYIHWWPTEVKKTSSSDKHQ